MLPTASLRVAMASPTAVSGVLSRASLRVPTSAPAHLTSSASPLMRPWWREMSQLLQQTPAACTCAVSHKRGESCGSSRRISCNLGSSGASSTSSRRNVSSVPRTAAAAAASEVAEVAVADEEVEGAATEEGEEARPMKSKALTKRVKHIMTLLNDEAVAKARTVRDVPNFRPGDVLAMRVEIPENKQRVSLVRGIVMGRRNAGINSTFRIRRMIAGVGVEMVFPLYSPNIKELKVVDRRKARRAKLYYLRDKIAKMSTVN
eukprot:TRINITY_DN23237_c0_g1_i1.p1 TRINITY_DN23237_c0_g1~~TRINITY_DN23237_c0_g1_i1.p1  ORF type:complete len:261 (-),score=57.00 TRINITY_DN23237_c0_g1_i1:434-1216(-)